MEQTIAAVDLTPFLPRIATSWTTDEPSTTWRSIDGSLVFADISGFTALSERLAKRGPIGAEELTEVLGACFADLLAVAYAAGGSLIKFGGDALLLLFDGPGHPLRAARAALGMRAALRIVGNLTTSVGAVRLRMSQGVHSGEIHVFRVGASHKELMICGPAATTVVEMEGAAGAGQILLSANTASALAKLAPELLGAAKGGGTLLRTRSLVHVVEGYPAQSPASAAAAAGLPVALRGHLAAGGDDSEHRYVSIAFVHFDGTDQLLVGDGPASVAEAVEELVSAAQSAVEAEDTTFLATDIDKDGGKIILIAGAPVAQEDAEGRLLRTVRRIVDARTRLPVRVGVNRGHVFAGAIGPPYRRTYTVMGDAVNLAARLMAKAAPGEIVVAPTVLERSRTSFVKSTMQPFMVKGKSAPIHAFTLGTVAGTQDTRASVRVPLVGRADELALLDDAVKTGGHVIDVIGDAGIGKTRLLDEVRQRHQTSMAVRVVTCEQYEKSTPYFAFRVLLRHALRASTVAELRDSVVRLAPQLERWLPLIGDVVNLAVPETVETIPLEGTFRADRTRRAATELIVALFPRGALVAFDDAQWMDAPSRALLANLLSVLADSRLTVCVARREADFDVQPTVSLGLARLSPGAARQLVLLASKHDPLPPDRIDELIERAAGNPLFLEELVRVAVQNRDGQFPGSVEAIIAAEIDRLPPADRRLLRQAAVLGDSFQPELLAEVAADPTLDALAVEQRLGALVERFADDRVRFRHRLVRDVAYQTLPFRQRHDLHSRAVGVIERSAGDDEPENPEVLSLHCFEAQQFEKCWRYARVGALRARQKFAIAVAIELYERAIAAARRVAGDIDKDELAITFLDLGKVRELAGRLSEANAAYQQARRLWAGNALRGGELCMHHAQVAEKSGQNRASIRWLMRGLRELEHDDSPEAAAHRAHLMTAVAWARQQSGKPREAVRWCLAAIFDAGRGHNDEALAQAYALADQAYVSLGEPEKAVYGELALEIYERLERRHGLAIHLLNMGVRAYLEGRWDSALTFYRRSSAKFAEIGDYLDGAMSLCNTAEVYTDQGRLDEADAALDEALTTWRSMKFTYGVAVATRYMGRVALRRGDVDTARRLFTDARREFEAFGVAAKLVELDAWLAECALVAGDVDHAAALLESALTREMAAGSVEMRPMIHRLQGCVAAQRGDLVVAEAELEECLRIARRRASGIDVVLAIDATEAIARFGGHPLSEDARRERERWVADLGVQVTSSPPLHAGRLSRRRSSDPSQAGDSRGRS